MQTYTPLNKLWTTEGGNVPYKELWAKCCSPQLVQGRSEINPRKTTVTDKIVNMNQTHVLLCRDLNVVRYVL